MTHYFLSASIPDAMRDPQYVETADITAVREAVAALAAAVFKRGRLVLGGHPAITPLVLVVAQSLHAEARVRLYQSDYFRNQIPLEGAAFPDLVWTPRIGDSLPASLHVMRERMIADGPFGAAFFIGGMQGVETEFELFRQRWPHTATYPIASTGAAARMLLDKSSSELPGINSRRRSELRDDVVYGALFERLLGPLH